MAHSPIFRNAPCPRSQTAGHRGLKQSAELRRGGGIRARGKFQAPADAIACPPGAKPANRAIFAWKPLANARLVRRRTPDAPARCDSHGEARFSAIAMHNPAERPEDRLIIVRGSRGGMMAPPKCSAASTPDIRCRAGASDVRRRRALRRPIFGQNPIPPQAEAAEVRYIRLPEKREPNA
jgi:hypothetical protein